MQFSRTYATTVSVRDPKWDLSVDVVSLPDAALGELDAALGFGGGYKLIPNLLPRLDYEVHQFFEGPRVGKNELRAVIALLVTDPSFLREVRPDHEVRERGLSIYNRVPAVAELVDQVLEASVTAREGSPVSLDPLLSLAMASGAGLGIAVAVGALSPIAFITVPTGIVVVRVARAMASRIGGLINGPQDKLEPWRQMLKEGKISLEQYDEAIMMIMVQDLKTKVPD